MLFVFNRRTISQAGRRGFDPRLPLSSFQQFVGMCRYFDHFFKWVTAVTMTLTTSRILLKTNMDADGCCRDITKPRWIGYVGHQDANWDMMSFNLESDQPIPQVARYTGSEGADDANNFKCLQR